MCARLAISADSATEPTFDPSTPVVHRHPCRPQIHGAAIVGSRSRRDGIRMHYSHVYDETTGLIALVATGPTGYQWTAVLDPDEFDQVVELASVLELSGIRSSGADDLRWTVAWVTGRDPVGP